MKGPFERLKYDLYRIWECPVCHYRARSSGATTTLVCSCQAKQSPQEVVGMKLAADGARRVEAAEAAVATASEPGTPERETPAPVSPSARAVEQPGEADDAKTGPERPASRGEPGEPADPAA